jgi:hypothetical protein
MKRRELLHDLVLWVPMQRCHALRAPSKVRGCGGSPY